MTQTDSNISRHYYQLTSEQCGQIETLYDLGLTNMAIAKKSIFIVRRLAVSLSVAGFSNAILTIFYYHYFGEMAQIKDEQR